MLAKSKLNSTETLISQALIEFEINHEEFKTIVNEKKYKRMKENIKTMKSYDDLDKNNKSIREKKRKCKELKKHFSDMK